MNLKHFNLDEFTCRCGCGDNRMDPAFLERLDALRDRLGVALPVNSGYRCPAHNSAVGRTGATGPHTTGRAADVLLSGAAVYKLLQFAPAFGMTGIGLRQKGWHMSRYVHLDNLPSAPGQPRPWVWTY